METRRNVQTHGNTSNLADILEKVLDKGVVVAGDINVSIAEIELVSIKIRLVICSVDKAKELGINWWQNDPYLTTNPDVKLLEQQNQDLMKRLESLEKKVAKK